MNIHTGTRIHTNVHRGLKWCFNYAIFGLISSESRQGFTAIGNGENMSVRLYDRVSDGKFSYGPLDWTQTGRQASGRGGRHFGLNGEG